MHARRSTKNAFKNHPKLSSFITEEHAGADKTMLSCYPVSFRVVERPALIARGTETLNYF